MRLNRRHWLQLALAQSVVGAAAPLAANTGDRITFDATPFRLGVASGHPTSQSVVLWTRLLASNPVRYAWKNQTVHVGWQIAQDPDFTQGVLSGDTFAPPELSHSVHVEVEGLQPNRVYWYRFVSGNQTSPVGRTRTLPAPDDTTTPLKVGFASCQRYHSGPFAVYDHMAADNPDLVVFLGDYIYEMGATQNEARGSWMYPATRIQEYRELYELAKMDPALQKMHAACPWLVTWDDHEVVNDYAGGDVRLRGDTGKTAKRMEMGYRTWYEHMPVSPKALLGGTKGLLENTHELRIYGTYRWGQTANLHLLDTRQYRSTQAKCGVGGLFKPGSCTDTNTTGRTMLGDAQAQWLDDQLKANGQGQPGATRWNLVCQPAVFSQFVIPALGGTLNHDNWDGYPASRARILNTIAQAQTQNPVFVAGDIHQNWVAHVHQDPANLQTPVLAPEFCVSSVTTPSFGNFTADEMKALAPNCVYADRHRRGYSVAQVTPQGLTMVVKHVDLNTGAAQTAATFQVQASSPQIRQVG